MTSAPLLALLLAAAPQDATRPPNVVVIVSDDAGYADFSMHGAADFPTPNVDRIAREGVRFAQGYVSASVCSPSRAGLITGRYQQRFGHTKNVPPRYSEENGLPVEERTFADALRAEGYRTIALGKWHLGYAPHFHPLARGFDDYYGFLQGARSYWPIEGNRLNRMLRDRDPVPEDFTYVTDALGAEAAAYVEAHAARPFFLYLAFNAVHGPLHAKEADLAEVDDALTGKRRTVAAMTASLDDAVGVVLDALDRAGVADDTLVVFLNDNGGQTANGVSNGNLRGKKGQPYEGGIRVPFVARWPARWPAGLVYDAPVSALDLLPTALAAAGAEPDASLDGVDLTPFVTGAVEGRPHERLVWARGDDAAVRRGDLKLVQYKGGPFELYDLAADPSETRDLAAARPADVRALVEEFVAFRAETVPARWSGPRTAPVELPPATFDAPWRRHTVDDASRGADGVRVADADGDGDLDVATGWEEGGVVRVAWNPGPDAARAPWPATTVGEVGSPEDAVLVDLDGDGALDVVSSCEGSTRALYAHLAPRDGTTWTTRELWTPLEAQWMFALPLDLDGRNGVDLVVGSKGEGGALAALLAPVDPREDGWLLRNVRDVGWTMSLEPADLDGDGDLDVVLSDRRGPGRGVHWLDNPGADGHAPGAPTFTARPIGGHEHEVMFLDVADANGDGRDDVVCATRDGETLLFLRTADEGVAFDEERVPNPFGAPHGKAVRVADVDGDGASDLVVSTNTGGDEVRRGVAWQRRVGDGWATYDVSGPEGVKFDLLELLDLDGDGDLDVLTCEERVGLGVVWYENPLR